MKLKFKSITNLITKFTPLALLVGVYLSTSALPVSAGQWYRLVITGLKGGNNNIAQLDELGLYDSNFNRVNSGLTEILQDIGSGNVGNATETQIRNLAPGQSTVSDSGTGQHMGQSTTKLFDGSFGASSKWTRYANCIPVTITMHLADNAAPVAYYNFASGADTSDNPSRATASWRLEYSSDGVNWSIFDEKKSATPVTASSTWLEGGGTANATPNTYIGRGGRVVRKGDEPFRQWVRFTITKKSYDPSLSDGMYNAFNWLCELRQFGVFAANNTCLNLDLKRNITIVPPVSPYTIYNNKENTADKYKTSAEALAPGEFAYYAAHFNMSETEKSVNLFKDDSSKWESTDIPQLANGDQLYHQEFTMRLPDNVASMASYDLRLDQASLAARRAPISWTVETSSDGINWHLFDERNDFTPPTTTGAWYFGDDHNNNISWFTRLANFAGTKIDDPNATGGDYIYKVDNDYVHVFRNTSAAQTFHVNSACQAKVLVIAGGGNGGSSGGAGGGGGAGGFIEEALEFSAGDYLVKVGAANADSSIVKSGGAQIYLSHAGGNGGKDTGVGADGGSGGGGAHQFAIPGPDGGASNAVSPEMGHVGSAGGGNNYRAGGGGGAGSAGSVPNGGLGAFTSITGFDSWYCGGGGGGVSNSAWERGLGQSGGGNGALNSVGNATSATTPGSGGGGGASGWSASSGMQGIVVIRVMGLGSISLNKDKATYNDSGWATFPTYTVHDNAGNTLIKDTHYTTDGWKNALGAVVTTAAGVGTYTLTVTGINGKSGTLTATYVVSPKVLQVPSDCTSRYTGVQQDCTPPGVDKGYLTMGNGQSAGPGSRNVTFKLGNGTHAAANLIWSDGTTTDKTITWTIESGTLVDRPTQGPSTFYADGTDHRPNISGTEYTATYNPNTQWINIGTYTATIKLSSGYQWKTGNADENIVFTYSIVKALPGGYESIDKLHFNGSNFVRMRYVPSAKTWIKTDVQALGTYGSGGSYLYGCYFNNRYYGECFNSSAQVTGYIAGNWGTSYGKGYRVNSSSTRSTTKLYQGGLWWGGNFAGGSGYTGGDPSYVDAVPIVIGGLNNALPGGDSTKTPGYGVPVQPFSIYSSGLDLYSFQIYESANGSEHGTGDTLKYDLVPVKRTADNVEGLLDMKPDSPTAADFYPLQIQAILTLDPNTGDALTKKYVYAVKGESLPDVDVPTKANCNFKGYYTAASDGTQIYDDTGHGIAPSTYTAATALYAQWEVTTVTVTLNKNATDATNPNPTTVTATPGSAMPTLVAGQIPARTGYTFTGYFTSATGGTKYYNSDGTSAKVYPAEAGPADLYAQWTENSYTVKFNGNGSTSGSMSDQTYTYTESKALSANGFTRAYTVSFNSDGGSSCADQTANYTFDGWAANAEGGGDKIPDKTVLSGAVLETLCPGGGEIAAYATWQSASITLPTPTKKGYTFMGWWTATSGGTKVGDAGASYTPTANVTLYAHWTANTYTMTFKPNGGTNAESSENVTYGGALPNATPAVSPVAGVNFTGYYDINDVKWYEANGTPVSGKSPYTLADHLTLYAHWDATAYYKVGSDSDANKSSFEKSGDPENSDTTKRSGWALTKGGTPIVHTVMSGCNYNLPGGANLRTPTGTHTFAGDSLTVSSTFIMSQNATVSANIIANGGNVTATWANPNNCTLNGTISVESDKRLDFYAYRTSTLQNNCVLNVGSTITGSGNLGILLGAQTDAQTSQLKLTGNMSEFTGNLVVATKDENPENFGKYILTISGAFGGGIASLPHNDENSEGSKIVVNYDGLTDGATKGLPINSTTIPLRVKDSITFFGSSDFGAANFPLMTFPAGTEVDPTTFTVYRAETEGGTKTAFTNLGKIVNSDSTITLVANAQIVEKPTAVTGLVYNGSEQTGVAAATGYTVTDGTKKNAGNYTATATLVSGYLWPDGTDESVNVVWSIATKGLKVTGVTVSDREYDGTSVATLNTTGKSLEGVCSGDDVQIDKMPTSGYFLGVIYDDSPNVGTKHVTYNPGGVTLKGAQAGNYNVGEIDPNITMKVTARVLSLTWSGTSFTYDGNSHCPTCTLGNFVSGEGVGSTPTVTGAATAAGTHTATVADWNFAGTGMKSNYALPESRSTTFTIVGPTVTLNKCGGSEGTDSVVATPGNAMPTIEPPFLNGYSFKGYFTQEGGAGVKYYNADGTSARTYPATDFPTTLYANWEFVKTYYLAGKDSASGSQPSFDGTPSGKENSKNGWAETSDGNSVRHTVAAGHDYVAGYLLNMDRSKGAGQSFKGNTLTLSNWLYIYDDVTIQNLISKDATVCLNTDNVSAKLSGEVEIAASKSLTFVVCKKNRHLEVNSKIIGDSTTTLQVRGQNMEDTGLVYTFSGDASEFEGQLYHNTTSGSEFNAPLDILFTGSFGGRVKGLPVKATNVVFNYDGLPETRSTRGLEMSCASQADVQSVQTNITFYSSSANFSAAKFPLMTFPAGTTVTPTDFTVYHAAKADGNKTAFENLGKIVNSDNTITLVANVHMIAKPTAVTGLVYNGNVQTGVAEGAGYTVANGSATDANSYTATATLKSGYVWSDGTTDAVSVPWSIAKATNAWAPTPALSATTFAANRPATITWGVAQFGGEATATLDEQPFTKTSTLPANLTDGSHTLVFTVAETSNYTGLSETIDFTVTDALYDLHAISATGPVIKDVPSSWLTAAFPTAGDYQAAFISTNVNGVTGWAAYILGFEGSDVPTAAIIEKTTQSTMSDNKVALTIELPDLPTTTRAKEAGCEVKYSLLTSDNAETLRTGGGDVVDGCLKISSSSFTVPAPTANHAYYRIRIHFIFGGGGEVVIFTQAAVTFGEDGWDWRTKKVEEEVKTDYAYCSKVIDVVPASLATDGGWLRLQFTADRGDVMGYAELDPLTSDGSIIHTGVSSDKGSLAFNDGMFSGTGIAYDRAYYIPPSMGVAKLKLSYEASNLEPDVDLSATEIRNVSLTEISEADALAIADRNYEEVRPAFEQAKSLAPLSGDCVIEGVANLQKKLREKTGAKLLFLGDSIMWDATNGQLPALLHRELEDPAITMKTVWLNSTGPSGFISYVGSLPANAYDCIVFGGVSSARVDYNNTATYVGNLIASAREKGMEFVYINSLLSCDARKSDILHRDNFWFASALKVGFGQSCAEQTTDLDGYNWWYDGTMYMTALYDSCKPYKQGTIYSALKEACSEKATFIAPEPFLKMFEFGSGKTFGWHNRDSMHNNDYGKQANARLIVECLKMIRDYSAD